MFLFASVQALQHTFVQKNPKVQSESLEWLGQPVKEFDCHAYTCYV